MIKERTSNQLLQYFSKNIPEECMQLTYKLFRKKVEENPELVRKFDDSTFFKKIHGYLIKTGYQERDNFEKEQELLEKKKLEYKIGPVTTPTNNNSWQFGLGHTDCPTFRSSSEVYSDLDMDVMSTTVNCPEFTRRCKNKSNLFLEEELFNESELIKEDLKGYLDLSVQSIDFDDCSYRPLNFSNGRVYLD